MNFGNLNLIFFVINFRKTAASTLILFEYIVSQIHVKVKIFFAIHLFLFFSLPLFCQISWDFETPIDVADNSFGNSSAYILIDEDGNPQVVVGKPNIGLYFIKSEFGVFSNPELIPSTENMFINSTNGPTFSSHENKIGISYIDNVTGITIAKFIQSIDYGTTWNNPVDIFSGGFEDFSIPVFSYDSDGNPFVISKVGEDPNVFEGFSKSNDGGLTFLPFNNINSNLGTGITCECCPSRPIYYKNRYYNVFRRNENNLRDFWIISSSDGLNWNQQLDIDPSDWMLNGCPSSGASTSSTLDTCLASVFMSGGGGTPQIYLNLYNSSFNNVSSTVQLSPSQFKNITQNHPDISSGPTHTAVVWEQFDDGYSVQFTIAENDNIPFGLVDSAEPLSINNDGSNRFPKVKIFNNKVHVIWQNSSSGTVKYIRGTITNFNMELEPRELIKVVNVLGQEINPSPNKVLLFLYDDGSVEKKIIVE